MNDLLVFSPAGKEGRVARGEPLHSARVRRSGRRPVSIQKLSMQETLSDDGTDTAFETFEAASETTLCLFRNRKKCTENPKSATAQPYGKISLVGYFESVLPLAPLPRRASRHYSPRADPARPGNAAARLVPASREALRERSRSRDPAPRTFATPRATRASEIPHRPGREKARSAHVASSPPFR